MKKILVALLLAVAPWPVFAQTDDAVVGESINGSFLIDSTLVGARITDVLPGGVRIFQTYSVDRAFSAYLASNAEKRQTGYRIRIYIGSGQMARNDSYSAMVRFREMYPMMSVDRDFDNPNFVVTAGNFRTKLDAESVMGTLVESFPSAAIVREKFRFWSVK